MKKIYMVFGKKGINQNHLICKVWTVSTQQLADAGLQFCYAPLKLLSHGVKYICYGFPTYQGAEKHCNISNAAANIKTIGNRGYHAGK